MEENEEIRKIDDELLLEKSDEAVESQIKIQINGDASIKSKSEEEEEDELLTGVEEEFLETLIDQKDEDELLNLEDEQPSFSVEKELEELFNVSVQKEKFEKTEETPKLATDNDSKQDDNGLLDECEPPKEIPGADEQSNEVPSNEDEESNQNGISDHDNDSCDAVVVKESNEINPGEEKQEIITNKAEEEEQKEDDTSITALVIDENIESTENISTRENSNEKEKKPPPPLESEDVDMIENGEVVTEQVDQINDIVPNEQITDVDMADLTKNNEIKNTLEEESKPIVDIKTEDDKSDLKIVPSERIQLTFMRKFAKECGKLSRADLEEVLLEKVTESIVYKSQCTELRTMYEKQEETIERLQKRLAAVTKQYNDLDMIHKRVEKDLKERPEGPIQPVRITRAVGLQVFLEKGNSNPSPNNISKGKQISGTNVIAPNHTTDKNSTSIIKRSIEQEAVLKNNLNESEPKRKKCKILPLRPVLSEKEETSLKMQVMSMITF